jgi:hypothetical protein
MSKHFSNVSLSPSLVGWPLGVVLLAIVYAWLSVRGLADLVTTLQLSRVKAEPNPLCAFDCGGENILNPWNSPWGFIFSGLYLIALLGSIGMALGRPLGRALVTVALSIFICNELLQASAFFWSEGDSFASVFMSWWQGWVFLPAWLALNVWYLFISNAKKYFVGKNA